MTKWDFADEIFDTICGGNVVMLLITILLIAGVILLTIELGPGKAHPLSTALKNLGNTMNQEVIGRLERLETKDEEKGMKDAANMGAAMAPAAADTILRYLDATGRRPDNFDLIVTGDLGFEGNSILADLLTVSGVDVSRPGLLNDCGMLIFDRERQDVHSGGSGCGCSAVVLASHLLPRISSGELREVLFIGTGAMMSPSSTKQGEAIPAVAHLVHLVSPSGGAA